jgi:hypothetical protein
MGGTLVRSGRGRFFKTDRFGRPCSLSARMPLVLRSLRRWWLIAACAAVALPGASAAREVPASLTVAPRSVSRPIPQGFLGLALEYSGIRSWVGPGGAVAANPVLVQLIRNLDPVGRPVIRVGGLSTDRSWWPVPGMSEPLGVTFTLTPAWAQSLDSLARAVNARLVLGVNLEAGSPRLAQTEADAFLSSIGRRYVSALDIGNEPPLYPSVPWYRRQGSQVLPWYSDIGTPVFSRDLRWGPASFVTQYARILDALPRIPIAGPDTQRASWFAAYERFLSPHSRVRMLASHGYGLNNCVTNPASAAYPSIPHLLNDYALHDLLNTLTPYVAAAHRNGAAFRIDEMGSVTCNGRLGVSDTMASALWGAGALFSVAQDGVDGVNLHSYPGLSNGLFDFTDSARGWSADVHPLYYGALLFSQAAPAGSRLLHVTFNGPPDLHGWATAGPGRVRHVILLNDSLTDSAAVAVRASRGVLGTGSAQLSRLSAPSVGFTGAVSLGGRSFGAATTSGRLRPPVSDPVVAHGRVYRLTVPAGSAAVLSFSQTR